MDIDLAGVFAAFVGLALVAVALAWALVAVVVVLVRSRVDAAARTRRALVGPAICAAGGALLYLAGLNADHATQRAFDEIALFAAPGVPLIAIVATLFVRSRRRAERSTRDARR